MAASDGAMDANVIAAMVALVGGIIIATGYIVSVVNDGEMARDDMHAANYKPPPPLSATPSPPSPSSFQTSLSQQPALATTRRELLFQEATHNPPDEASFKLTNVETVNIVASRAKHASTARWR